MEQGLLHGLLVERLSISQCHSVRLCIPGSFLQRKAITVFMTD